MKVLQVCKYYPPVFGGIEQVAYDISSGFVEYCNESVDVLCVNNKFKSVKEHNGYNIFRSGILTVLFSTPISISFFNYWIKLRNQYDIIHLHLPNPLAVLAIFLFPTRSKIIIHWHSDIVKQKKLLRLFKPLQTWVLNRCNSIIVTSPVYGERSLALKDFQNKITCIPIGIEENRLPDNDDFLIALENKFAGKRIVFSLGRMVYYKGFSYLINAAKYLPDDVVILIGGEGELYDELFSKIKEEKLEAKVFLLGGIPFNKLSSYYKLCDLFCLPSIHESEAFGVVQLESMSYKKPIVSTDIPRSGVPWVNEHNVSGIVVPPADSEKLADGINKVLENKDAMAIAAYQRFLSNFTKEKMVNSLKELYVRLK